MSKTHCVLEPWNSFTKSLRLLKDRIREAAATEMARIVSQTVEDVLQAILHRPAILTSDKKPKSSTENTSSLRSERSYQAKSAPNTKPWFGWLVRAGGLALSCFTRPTCPWWPAIVMVGAGLASVTQQPFLWSVLETVQMTAELLAP